MDLIKKYLHNKLVLIGVAILVIGGIGFKFWQHQPVDNQQVFQEEQLAVKQSSSQSKTATSKKSARITVDIFGAVAEEGVYNLAANARLNDLLKLAGGVTAEADLKAVNRASILKDQDKIYIPYQGEVTTATPTQISGNVPSADANPTLVNINTATATELQELNGIGAKKAEQIIKYREEAGPFKEPKDLTAVAGIGEKTFENLADQITV